MIEYEMEVQAIDRNHRYLNVYLFSKYFVKNFET